jgi:hypothetical protein
VRTQWADQQGQGASLGPGQGDHATRLARFAECGKACLLDQVPQFAILRRIGGAEAALATGEAQRGTQQPLSYGIRKQYRRLRIDSDHADREFFQCVEDKPMVLRKTLESALKQHRPRQVRLATDQNISMRFAKPL